MPLAIEFLIGPAGSGKTHACLTQVRDALRAAPDGPTLIWIAPKQSTFQLEREILALGIRGFTRLQILPFDRLARRVLDELGMPVHDVLSEEGRVMALRAILLQRASQLTAFRASARAAGFAAQLSRVLRELQRGRIAPGRLRDVRLPSQPVGCLAAKLHDLALLLEGYREWLEEHRLRDSDDLLTLAAEALSQARKQGRPFPACGGLWLDGFAEMTVAELDLLAALLPGCDRATLAFCLERVPPLVDRTEPVGAGEAPVSASVWGVTATTYLRCRERIHSLGLPCAVRCLPAAGGVPPRFWVSPSLARLASAWTETPAVSDPGTNGMDGINLVECADPEAEALLAVRLINRHVRQAGGRYRDISVVVRRMDGYGEVLERALRRHAIPFFADHREPMGHHPVAELTRSALAMAAGGWAYEDWLGALKSGLVVDHAVLADHLENAGLASGLRGDEWMRLQDYAARARLTPDAARHLERPIAAFAAFRSATAAPLDGPALAGALRALWRALQVPETLERWQGVSQDLPPLYQAIHHTAWEQIIAWSNALALAFAKTPLPAADWATIAEAGLSGLTLGVVPPALDQVLVGAIDRARQPEVKLTIVPGLNEGVFPAGPAVPALLSRTERQALAEGGLELSWTQLQLAERERYYGYIACTRPSHKLCITWSRRGLDGKAQVRSSIAERVLALVGMPPDQEAGPGDVTAFDGRLKSFAGEPESASAVSLPELLECPGWDQSLPSDISDLDPALAAAAAATARLRLELKPAGGELERRLSSEAAASLHPAGVLISSLSALEDFAQCPFRHFAGRELHLEERDEFKADRAETGTLLHAILCTFHRRTLAERGLWRNWSPAEASQLVRQVGEEQLQLARFALLVQDPLVAWETRRQIRELSVMIEQAIRWMESYAFDPVLTEFSFRDGPGAEAPAWSIPIEPGQTLKLHGRIDRLDVCRLPDGRVLVAVFDYKSTARPPAAAQLDHGLELQLLGYLAFASTSVELRHALAAGAGPAPQILPAGAFYVPLTPKVAAGSRADPEEKAGQKYLDSLACLGRGDRTWLGQFDALAARSERASDRSRQFAPSHLVAGEELRRLLDDTQRFLRLHAAQILGGVVGIRPVRVAAGRSACDHCPFGPLCRFEPLLDEFRSLRPAAPPRDEEPEPAASDAD